MKLRTSDLPGSLWFWSFSITSHDCQEHPEGHPCRSVCSPAFDAPECHLNSLTIHEFLFYYPHLPWALVQHSHLFSLFKLILFDLENGDQNDNEEIHLSMISTFYTTSPRGHSQPCSSYSQHCKNLSIVFSTFSKPTVMMRSHPDILLMGSCYSFTLLPLHLPRTSSPNVTSQVDTRVWCPFPTWLLLFPHNDHRGLQSRDAALECLHSTSDFTVSVRPLGSFLPAFQNPLS